MRLPAILLLAMALCAAACTGSISQSVPAVVGDGGNLVNVSMALGEGDGTVFVSVAPATGVATQESIYDAVAYAWMLAGRDGPCDVMVSFAGNPSTSYIDGPSAGAALTVMAYSLLENRTMRNDTIITGTIEPDGTIGPVGGLYEKARGASDAGAAYFITPVETFYEILLLREIGESHGIRIVQAASVEDVIRFMLDGSEIPQSQFEIRERGVPDVPQYYDPGLAGFGPVAQRMISLERGLADAVGADGNETLAIKSFYYSEAARQEAMLGLGYAFSAANEAFLNYIDLLTIEAVGKGELDLPRAKGGAGICLGNVRRPAMTDLNWEWVAGADQRLGWAQEKLDNTETEGEMLEDERIYAFNQLMYARAWCEVAGALAAGAPEGGREINESAWEPFARERIEGARALGELDEDYTARLNIAQARYSAGRYAAAVFDATYVIETSGDEPPPGDANVSELVGESRSSLWGKVYQSHAAFLNAQNLTSAAYETARFARALDDATLRMVDEGEYADGGGEDEPLAEGRSLDPDWPGQAGWWPVALAACASMFLFLALLLLLTRRKHGNDRTGPLKADRAEEKEGGARVPGKGARRKG